MLAEKGKFYDVMLDLGLEYFIDNIAWLPYKTIDEETNSSNFRALLSGNFNGQNLYNTIVLEISIPNEGKIVESKEVCILNESESIRSNDSSVIRKFDMNVTKVISTFSRALAISTFPSRSNFIGIKQSMIPEIYLFDTNFIGNKRASGETEPIIKLKGHSASGYGMDWNPFSESRLISCSEGEIISWDIKNATQIDTQSNSDWGWKGPKEGYYDVKWSRNSENEFVYTSTDGHLGL